MNASLKISVGLTSLLMGLNTCLAESDKPDYKYHRLMLHAVEFPYPDIGARLNSQSSSVSGNVMPQILAWPKELQAYRVLDKEKLAIQWDVDEGRYRASPSQPGVLDNLPERSDKHYSMRLVYKVGEDTSRIRDAVCGDKAYKVVDIVPGKRREELYCQHVTGATMHEVTFRVNGFIVNRYVYGTAGQRPHWDSKKNRVVNKARKIRLIRSGYVAHPDDYSPRADTTDFERGFKNVSKHLVSCDNILTSAALAKDPNVKYNTKCIGIYDDMYVLVFSYFSSLGNKLSSYNRLVRIEKDMRFPRDHFDDYLNLGGSPTPILPCPVLCNIQGEADWDRYNKENYYTEEFNQSRSK